MTSVDSRYDEFSKTFRYYFNEYFPKITVNKIKRKQIWISQPSKMKKENYELNSYGEEKLF